MSTNATATIYEEYHDEPVVTIYKHWDGYPEGFGDELREFVSSRRLVNGLGLDAEPVANGMGDLAAQVVAHFKDKPGDVYLYPVSQADDHEYTYRIHARDGKAIVTCDQEPDW